MGALKAFLDMDGVIADFIAASCVAHNRSNPYLDPAYAEKAAGHWDINDLWDMSAQDFWRPCNSRAFWCNIPPTVEANSIVHKVVTMFGLDNVCILTAPNMAPDCIGAKRDWMKVHFPRLAGRMIFGKDKEFMASPKRVLIDDKESNCDAFRAAEGHAVLVPRLWNCRHSEAGQVMECLEKDLAVLETINA